jgi:twitching motility protein PilT
MAQLDRLLAAMVSNNAEALVLADGDVAKLEIGGTLRPITRAPLVGSQIAMLVKEAADPEHQTKLEAGSLVTFDRSTDDGAFRIRAVVQDGRWRVEARIDTPAEAQRALQKAQALHAAVDLTAHSANGKTRLTPATSAPPPPAPPPAIAAAPAAPAVPRASFASTGERMEDPALLDAIQSFEGSAEARAALDALLRTMVERNASDLHLRVGEPPILRLHGEMQRFGDHAPLSHDQLASMVRSVMPERNRIQYAETNDTDYAYELTGCARFRANAARDRHGAVAVFRQIPAAVVTVEQMGLSEEVQRLCFLTKGLVLVTGPTGSGKSTTLCALVDLINRSRHDHVLTIEDPIEFVHQNKSCIVTQRQVGVHTKSFKSALRAALREDPDIILVGEMRDLETVSIAIETAETGHLVFGTLHTTTASGTVDRVIDQFPSDRQEQIRVMLAESLKGVISQTLCKKIGGGRVAAREILLSTPSVTNLIREGKTFQIPSVIQTSKRLGMVTLNDALIEHVDAGVVEPREGYMKSVDKVGFAQMLKSRGLDTSFADEAQAKKPDHPVPTVGAPAKAAAGVRR